MLTKGNFRAVKYLVAIVALIAVLAMCLTACSGPAVKDVKYVDSSVTKAVYNEGDTFECAGAKITVTYEDGSSETVDVTATMTGTVVLKGVGAQNVSVLYTDKDGNAYTAYIPVTVVNPTKTSAIAALKTDAVAKDRLDDKGVLKLIEAYTLLINNAAAADISALSAEYTAAVKAYVEAKDACLAFINDEALLKGLYTQNVVKAASLKAEALTNYSMATEAAAFAEIQKAYKTGLDKLLADQEFYEGNDDENGQINDKIDILYLIEDYMAKIAERRDKIMAYQGVGTDDAKNTEAQYNAYIKKFDRYYKYVDLAINLEGLEAELNSYYVYVMRTDVDKIYDTLCDVETLIDEATVTITKKEDIMGDGAGITIYPVDTIKNLLTKIAGYKATAESQFGATSVAGMMESYVPFGAAAGFTAFDLQACVDEFTTAYTWLVNAQVAADAVEAKIDAIDLSDDSKTLAEHQATIIAAWNALIEWNGNYPIISTVTAPTFGGSTGAYVIKFELSCNGIYKLGMNESATAVAKEFASYSFSKDYVIKYMIANLQELLDATILGEKQIVVDTVAAIKRPIIYSTDLTVDAKESITKARTVWNEYKAKYYDDYKDNKDFFPVTEDGTLLYEKTVAAAEAEYKAIVDAADKLIAEIKALPDAENITIADYSASKDGVASDGKLKTVYNDYIKFTNEINHGLNDVIEVDGVEAKLLACIKAYIKLAWDEAKEVTGKLVITQKLITVLEGVDKSTEADIRILLSQYEDGLRADLAKVTYDNSKVGELLLISDFETALGNLNVEAERLANTIPTKLAELRR